MSHSVNNKIWMYWGQGELSAPNLVRLCFDSWRIHHPNHEIIVLDERNLSDYVDISWLPSDHMTHQWKTDIARIELLRKYGGVWADATLFCSAPLNHWLPEYSSDDFFAFDSAQKDRLISNWFIASSPQSKWINFWGDAVKEYALAHRFREPGKLAKFYFRKMMSLRKRGLLNNDVWFNHFATKFLKFRPYPVAMFLFQKALSTKSGAFEEWHSRKRLNDVDCHKIQNEFGMNALINEEAQSWLDKNSPKLHKLNWRQDLGNVIPNSCLHYIVERNNQDIRG